MACWCNGNCPYIATPRELMAKGRQLRAHHALRNVLTVAPLCVEANLMMAAILCRGNKAYAALPHIERAAQNADPARIPAERGAVLRAGMRLEEALKQFAEAQKLAPDDARVVSAMIGTLEVAGHLKDARQLVMSARARFPADADLRRLHATILDAQGETGDALAQLTPAPPAELSPIELLDRGRYLDKMGRHAEAWDSWMAGKGIFRDKFGHRYNAQIFADQTKRLAQAATAPRPNFVVRAPELDFDPAPLFICGFPRSGTTMLETMLTSHSAVVAGDELSGISDIVESFPSWMKVRVPYPDAMIASSLGENAVMSSLLRDFYWREAHRRIGFKATPALWRLPGSKVKRTKKPFYFTDKMPLNELHLPLIRMLFPTTPLFRMQRHPLDVMVSCMSNWLVHGGFYASSLEACATHYLAVDELVTFYRRTFQTQDRAPFRDVRYENFVKDQPLQTEAVLAAAGLDMEPACLAFHKNKRKARTLSYRQVQQPLNDRGIGRWTHYREQLAPAVEILRPILERDGYDF
jgi:Flp pilus assembly protein TadD